MFLPHRLLYIYGTMSFPSLPVPCFCCSCDCGRIWTQSTDSDGVMYTETVYNGTVTMETTFTNGTTVVQTSATNETTEFDCGYYARYRCIDPLSTCVDDDDYNSWGDDDSLSECIDEIWGCANSTECVACLTSASSADDDLSISCPIWSNTCSAYADFYCCAIDEVMDEGCTENTELVDYFGESIAVRSSRPG